MTQWTENGLIRELDLGSGTVPFYRDEIWEGPELYFCALDSRTTLSTCERSRLMSERKSLIFQCFLHFLPDKMFPHTV